MKANQIKAATMEHEASKSEKELSHMEMTIKTEVKAAATSNAHIDIEMHVNHMKQKRGSVRSMKSEPALLVKEEILEEGSQAGKEQQCVQGTTTPAGTGRVYKDSGRGDLFNVKHELEDIDIGPTVFQHMDIHYTVNKQNRSAGTGENAIVDGCNEAMPGSGVKKESHEAKLRGEKPCRRDTFVQHTRVYKDDKIHTGEKAYQCDTCDKRFAHSSALTQHMRIHTGEKPYQCDTCDKRFSHNCKLVQHMRVHTGEKPYRCETCDKRFSQSGILKQHMRIHTGVKPYRCDTCDKRFAHSGALTQHMRIHTGEKPYQCDTCDKRFAHSGALTHMHMRIHTGEKPYQCDTCDKRFSRNGKLVQHMRVHTGEKPYQCDTCDKRFAQSSNLTQHMRIHTIDKPYQCDTCDKRFSRKCELVQHIRVHTREKP